MMNFDSDEYEIECPCCEKKFKINCNTCGYSNDDDDFCKWNMNNENKCGYDNFKWKPKKNKKK